MYKYVSTIKCLHWKFYSLSVSCVFITISSIKYFFYNSNRLPVWEARIVGGFTPGLTYWHQFKTKSMSWEQRAPLHTWPACRLGSSVSLGGRAFLGCNVVIVSPLWDRTILFCRMSSFKKTLVYCPRKNVWFWPELMVHRDPWLIVWLVGNVFKHPPSTVLKYGPCDHKTQAKTRELYVTYCLK